MMYALPLLLISLFTFFAGLRGIWHLSNLSRNQWEPVQEIFTINHILLTSFSVAFSLAFSLLFPFFLTDLLGTVASFHFHPRQNNTIHQWAWFLSAPALFFGSFFLLLFYFLCVCGNSLMQWFQLLRWTRTFQRMNSRNTLSPSQETGSSLPPEMHLLFQGKIVLIPGAWSGLVGLFQPTLFLGTELIQTLTSEELHALLAHEEAHRQRKDTLFQFLLFVCSRLLPWVGAKLFKRWGRRTEELCDRFAASRMGDPLVVASALLKAHRIQRAFLAKNPKNILLCPNPAKIGFTEESSCIEYRIQKLVKWNGIHELPSNPSLQQFFAGKVLLVLMILQFPLHFFFDFLFSFF